MAAQLAGHVVRALALTALVVLAGCATTGQGDSSACRFGATPGPQDGPAERVAERSGTRAMGMGGSAAGQAARVTGNVYADRLLSGAVMDVFGEARRAIMTRDRDVEPELVYSAKRRPAEDVLVTMTVTRPAIDGGAWHVTVPMQGTVTARAGQVEIPVATSSRRDATVLEASCRALVDHGLSASS